jgi:GNAT superfamily N-acetyltransferase
VLTAPGVTAAGGTGRIGRHWFRIRASDGEIQAHLSNIVVARASRRQGIARQLLRLAIQKAGGERIDLVTDSASDFYASLSHKRTFAGDCRAALVAGGDFDRNPDA